MKMLIDEHSNKSPLELAKSLAVLAVDEPGMMDTLCTEAIQSLPAEARAIANGKDRKSVV